MGQLIDRRTALLAITATTKTVCGSDTMTERSLRYPQANIPSRAFSLLSRSWPNARARGKMPREVVSASGHSSLLSFRFPQW